MEYLYALFICRILWNVNLETDVCYLKCGYAVVLNVKKIDVVSFMYLKAVFLYKCKFSRRYLTRQLNL